MRPEMETLLSRASDSMAAKASNLASRQLPAARFLDKMRGQCFPHGGYHIVALHLDMRDWMNVARSRHP